jgi:hypothetical protein
MVVVHAPHPARVPVRGNKHDGVGIIVGEGMVNVG